VFGPSFRAAALDRDECHDVLAQTAEIRDRVMDASGLIFVAPCTSGLAGSVLQPITERQRPVAAARHDRSLS